MDEKIFIKNLNKVWVLEIKFSIIIELEWGGNGNIEFYDYI